MPMTHIMISKLIISFVCVLTLIVATTVCAAPLSAASTDAQPFFTSKTDGSTWKELGWSEPWNKHGHLSIGSVDGQKYLTIHVDVESGADLRLPPVTAGKVYRIAFEGRAVGQVEFMTLHFRQGPAPHTWHGSDHFAVAQTWQVYETQIKTTFSDSASGLYFEFKGMGDYQIRSVKVIEQAAFDLSDIQTDEPNRGELLTNTHFTLGSYGWAFTVPEYGGHANKYFNPNHDQNRIRLNAETGSYEFHNDAGIMGFLNHNDLITLRYGYQYTLRVEGDGADGDASLWLERPRQNIGPVKSKKPLQFRNGVAETTFVHEVPDSGTLSQRPDSVFVLVEHFAKQPLTIRSISLSEGKPAAAPSATAAATIAVPEMGVAVTGLDSPLNNAVTIGKPLQAVVTVAGCSADNPVPVVSLVISDAGNAVVATVSLADVHNGTHTLALPALPLGWYSVQPHMNGTPTPGCGAGFAVLPVQRTTPTSKPFLGAHIANKFDRRQTPQMGRLGFKTARCFEFGWAAIEPEQGDFNLAMADIDRYLDAGLDPMVILNGSPRWASSAPDSIRDNPDPWAGWSSYPPKNIDDWGNYVRKMVVALKGKVHVYEIWNEPNNYFMKISKDHPKNITETYVELAKVAYGIIKQIDPQATVVVGATAGSATQFFKDAFAAGLLSYCDVISYHAYGQQGSNGAAMFADQVSTYRSMMKSYGAIKPIWDSESGYTISEGAAGLNESATLITGIVDRMANGIEHYFVYTSAPRTFPGQTNFHMVTGFADSPLVTVPMLAVFDTLLGDASFVDTVAETSGATRLHRFTGPDGDCFIGWNVAHDTERSPVLNNSTAYVCIDIFGNVVAQAHAHQFEIVGLPRYFVPAATARRLLAP